MNKEIDIDLITNLIPTISHRINLIAEMFKDKKEKQYLLKNLAASSIHLSFFMKDLHKEITGEKIEIPKNAIDEFLESFGCKNEEK